MFKSTFQLLHLSFKNNEPDVMAGFKNEGDLSSLYFLIKITTK